MKFKKVNRRTALRVQDLEGDPFEGVYVGKEKGNFGDNYRFISHGREFVIYRTHALAEQMDQIEPSYEVKITYRGPKELEGGNVFHEVEVEVSEEPVEGFDLTPYSKDVSFDLKDIE